MSSTYRILCLSHDPAIAIDREWDSPNDAIAHAADPRSHEVVSDHAGCDLLVGRYSYPLIELACPPRDISTVRCGHRREVWIDIEWIRLLAVALDIENPALQKAVEGVVRPYRCWTRQRVQRLRSVL